MAPLKLAALLLTALAALAAPANARQFARCELAVELVRLGLPQEQMGDWVCLVESESARNSSAVGGPNSNGSFDWGLFQINDGIWCSVSDTPGRNCTIRCTDLVDDDITDDVGCANIIYDVEGFGAWHGWTARCQGVLPDVSGCFPTGEVEMERTETKTRTRWN